MHLTSSDLFLFFVKVGHLIQGHIDDLTHTELIIGETLEIALELGEKHEVFVSTCKEVSIKFL